MLHCAHFGVGSDDFSAQQIAAELTRKEQQLFASIPQSEFLEKLGISNKAAEDTSK